MNNTNNNEIIDIKDNVENNNTHMPNSTQNNIVQPQTTTISNSTNDDKNSSFKNKKRLFKPFYLDFTSRVIICIVLLFIFGFLGTILMFKSFTIRTEQRVDYTERSNLFYQVYLKDNDFYESKFLEKDMIYVASLIDYINIVFNYNFDSNAPIDLRFDYDITANVVIYDENEKNTYYEKKYTLLEKQSVNMENDQHRNISEVMNIDYNEFNRLTNEFKNTYGLKTVSKLIVDFNITKVGEDNFESPENKISLVIPLSERSIDIKMDYQDINNQSNIISYSSISLSNYILIGISVILYVLTIYVSFRLIKLLLKLLPKHNRFDEYIDKIFKEYDRLVVSTTSIPVLNSDKNEIIEVDSFDGLLDVRDNLKTPIMWYLITPHVKGCFYIKHDETVYINFVKKVDLDKKKEKKEEIKKK